MSAWNSMWTTVITAYDGNGNVYLEPMNEPHGYSSADWRNLAASWLTTHTGANKSRVLIGGTGYSQDLRDLCGDSRFSSTLFSFHIYTFFYNSHDTAGWQDLMKTRLGSCASRAVVTEFGAQMDKMGGTYWPALGGRPGANGYDPYSTFSMGGSGTNRTLTVRNTSGRDRVRYGWGL